MSGRFAVAARVLALMLTGHRAVAGDESELVRGIEDDLQSVRGYLDGIAGDSSDGDIRYALDYAGRVRDKAERLRSLNPQSEPARTMADKYPDWVRSFSDSTAALGQLKVAQLRIRDDRLVERCRDVAGRLRERSATA